MTTDGDVVAMAVREHGLSTPRAGWAEHDAESVWWADFTAICRELSAVAPVRIGGVGVSGIGPCLLPCDSGGTPLRPAILYGIDTRATAQIHEIDARYGPDEILQRCGSRLTSQAVGPKVAWLRQSEPEVYARTSRIFMASSWLVHRLTGEYVLDHHSASQCAPLYDPVAHGWIRQWCDDVARGIELPRLLWPGEIAGVVTAGSAAVTGIPAGTPVIAGTIDAWTEAVSVGVTAPGDLMLMYGSTMFIVQVLARRQVSPALWSTVGVEPGSYDFAAGMATSGSITDWLRRLTGAGFDALTAAARDAGRGADGLLMLPYFAGERTPLFDPDARGLIAGLTLRHEPGHLYRAALEGTAFGVRHNLEAMRDAGAPPARMVAVGGGTSGGLWTQIVSDVLQQPQQICERTVGAAYGDARLVAAAVGVAGTEGWNPVVTRIEPDPGAAGVYDALYADYRALYESTADIAHRLAARQRG